MRKLLTVGIVGMLVLGWMLLVSSSMALAAGGKGKKKNSPEVLFKKLDADNDGKLTAAEFSKITEFRKNQNAKPKKLDKMFARLDADNNGSLSLEEFKKITEKKNKKKANPAS